MIAYIDGSRKLEGEMDEVAKVTDNRKQFFPRRWCEVLGTILPFLKLY